MVLKHEKDVLQQLQLESKLPRPSSNGGRVATGLGKRSSECGLVKEVKVDRLKRIRHFLTNCPCEKLDSDAALGRLHPPKEEDLGKNIADFLKAAALPKQGDLRAMSRISCKVDCNGQRKSRRRTMASFRPVEPVQALVRQAHRKDR